MNGPEEHLAFLEKQVADHRAHGYEPTQAMLDQVEAQKVNVRENNAIIAAKKKAAEERQAADEAAARAGAEAALKGRALAAFTASGGTPADFEKDWPELRKKVIEQSTLDRMGQSGTEQQEIMRRKLAQGYQNAF